MKIVVLLACVAVLAGCVPSQPIVSDYNGASVKIVQDNMVGEGVRSAVTDAEATRICTKGGKRIAEYASTRFYNDYQVEHLYLCL